MEHGVVIRLVTQFDHPTAQPAAATPTCCGGCSCCCCCCIVTATIVSAYSARSAGRIQKDAEREAPGRIKWERPWPAVLGFFALPLGLFVLYVIGSLSLADVVTVLIVPIVWLVALGFAFSGAGALRPWARASAVVGVGLVGLVVEFFLWLAAVDSSIE